MAQHEQASCWNCGYDLTGVDVKVCPECGEPVTSGPFFETLLATNRGTGRRRCVVCKTVAAWPDTVCPTCGSKIGMSVKPAEPEPEPKRDRPEPDKPD